MLAHILRRPIIVYSVKYIHNYRDEPIGLANFQGQSRASCALERASIRTCHLFPDRAKAIDGSLVLLFKNLYWALSVAE